MLVHAPVGRTCTIEAVTQVHATNVWQVVGKVGRAETATDPSGLDMVETIINLRDRTLWPKRKLRIEDATAQAGVVLAALQSRGILPASSAEEGN